MSNIESPGYRPTEETKKDSVLAWERESLSEEEQRYLNLPEAEREAYRIKVLAYMMSLASDQAVERYMFGELENPSDDVQWRERQQARELGKQILKVGHVADRTLTTQDYEIADKINTEMHSAKTIPEKIYRYIQRRGLDSLAAKMMRYDREHFEANLSETKGVE